jgi:hypothetical protein
VIFICGEIGDLVSESDKHCAYLDPDVDMNGEFDVVNEDEVEDLKRKYVLHLSRFMLLTYDSAKLGTQLHSCQGTLPSHP